MKYSFTVGDIYFPLNGTGSIIENEIEYREISENIILLLYQTINNETKKLTNA
jgi:hypothetical protein